MDERTIRVSLRILFLMLAHEPSPVQLERGEGAFHFTSPHDGVAWAPNTCAIVRHRHGRQDNRPDDLSNRKN